MVDLNSCGGLFAGLITLDVVSTVSHPIASNEKCRAERQGRMAGGPATNAAVAFAALGGRATLISAVGSDPAAAILKADLNRFGVQLRDVARSSYFELPIAAVTVDQSTGDRSVVYGRPQLPKPDLRALSADVTRGAGVLLLDGFYSEIAIKLAKLARRQRIPVVFDGGSFKADAPALLPLVDYAICSADFEPPGCGDPADTIEYLRAAGVSQVAITAGGAPVRYASDRGTGQIEIPQVRAVDTLGAGDIFHGAFCYYLVNGGDFEGSLRAASSIASDSCGHFGTRDWIGAL